MPRSASLQLGCLSLTVKPWFVRGCALFTQTTLPDSFIVLASESRVPDKTPRRPKHGEAIALRWRLLSAIPARPTFLLEVFLREPLSQSFVSSISLQHRCTGHNAGYETLADDPHFAGSSLLINPLRQRYLRSH
ncbi:uncharacterized protein LY79DRAFT_543306 [Colletotrichum navitas]|uniref:Uncharacterized protein n=1 Tax=Colletotrichum navitas TaxID=681940 RepID=A0AAD8Q830_9PEZI|nr:uncharacterized protein LY79DRAFT_543306 [Colletotrichum navitas]KAK1596966.1 hypothetical protein LY79DRAFT_543306 [Colletotrichum navitas]